MKNLKHYLAALLLSGLTWPALAQTYQPTEENLASRQEFADAKFGIFIHWGIYSTFAQGEWYLNEGKLNKDEYAKVADAFYPHRFDAKKWIDAFKDAGARYVCFTSRHHDGFSMWDTKQSDFNIVDATPYGKDVIKQLADECHKQDFRLHFYYSHLDWTREDYPWGSSGHWTGRDKSKQNWDSYYRFMNNQLTELLTNYGKIGAIWFDGWWDHNKDEKPFDWQLEGQYALIHKLQPGCLVGNNHHVNTFPGEDFQLFERDLPGANTTGWSKVTEISKMPLETCETMNGMWGYKVTDQNYKSTETLIRLLINTAGKGANLLLNIGPQPNGELPQTALERLKGMGVWLRANGETIYGTVAGDIPAQEWGVSTRKDNRLFLHITKLDATELTIPLACKVVKAQKFDTKQPIKFAKNKKTGEVTLQLPEVPSGVDYIVELTTK